MRVVSSCVEDQQPIITISEGIGKSVCVSTVSDSMLIVLASFAIDLRRNDILR